MNLYIPSKVTCFKFFLFKISFPWAPAFCRVSPMRMHMMCTQEAQPFLSRSPRRRAAYASVMHASTVRWVWGQPSPTTWIYFFHIGHEHPYGIKMSHLPSTTLLPQTPEDSKSPSTLQESLLLEQGITEMQGQFILKPRHLTQNQQGRGEPLPLLQVPSLGSCLHPWPQIHGTELILSVGGGEEQYRQEPKNYTESSLEKPKGLKSKPNSLSRKVVCFNSSR